MRKQIKRCLLSLCLCLSSQQSLAAIISYNGYTLDESTNIVTGGGLEWLQWDETKGQTINQALTNYTPAGWRLASNQEMASLFNAFVFNYGGTWNANESIIQHAIGPFVPGDDITSQPHKQLVALFGHTHSPSSIFDGGIDPFEYTGAFFGSDLNSNLLYKQAIVYDDFINSIGTPIAADAWIGSDLYSVFSVDNRLGVALVRDVPEPGMLSLFAFGLMAGGRALRKRLCRS